MEVTKNITRWLLPRTRSCSHFRPTERSCQIFVFHSPNHLSEWKEICCIPVITLTVCVRVRITSLPRIRIKNKEVVGSGESHTYHSHSASDLSKFAFYLEEWGSTTQGRCRCLYYPYIYLIFVTLIFTEWLWSLAKFGTLPYSDRQEIGTPTSWCHASIFYEPKSFYGIWINVRSAVLATTCQLSRINT